MCERDMHVDCLNAGRGLVHNVMILFSEGKGENSSAVITSRKSFSVSWRRLD